MQDWELDFYWNKVRTQVKDMMRLNALPDMNGILFLIGVQELGRWEGEFTKEEKQDLMHIAVCRLLEYDGYYEFAGRDADGWPHWKSIKPFSQTGVKEQEDLLKIKVIQYFRDAELEGTNLDN